ncbi:MAG TPA: hypothetical protein PLO84_09545 [Thermotogota bacterium]|nr:hypothetical protein [Thermotogota bacterium]
MSEYYQITVKSYLSKEFSKTFEGMTLEHLSNGTTCITGMIADQSALHGMLKKIRDMGIQLISVVPLQININNIGGH